MNGTCKFCGQMKEVFDAQSQQGADEKATAECGCEGAVFERRKESLKDGIRALFGKGADKRGFDAVSKLELELIEQAALRIMTGEVRKVNYDIACGDKVSIKEKDGEVIITRIRKMSGQVQA